MFVNEMSILQIHKTHKIIFTSYNSFGLDSVREWCDRVYATIKLPQNRISAYHLAVCVPSVGFTYSLDKLKTRASKFRGSPDKVYNMFNTVIGLSHICCYSVLYFLNNPSVIFLTQLHSISEYCRILNTPHLLRLFIEIG